MALGAGKSISYENDKNLGQTMPVSPQSPIMLSIVRLRDAINNSHEEFVGLVQMLEPVRIIPCGKTEDTNKVPFEQRCPLEGEFIFAIGKINELTQAIAELKSQLQIWQ